MSLLEKELVEVSWYFTHSLFSENNILIKSFLSKLRYQIDVKVISFQLKHQKEVEISKIDGKLHDEYEDRLQKALQELRDIYEKKMEENRDDFEKRYEDRVSDHIIFTIWVASITSIKPTRSQWYCTSFRSEISNRNLQKNEVQRLDPLKNLKSLVPELKLWSAKYPTLKEQILRWTRRLLTWPKRWKIKDPTTGHNLLPRMTKSRDYLMSWQIR